MTERTINAEDVKGNRTITWNRADVGRIYEELERPVWAPWLRASRATLEKRADVFRRGQLLRVNPNDEYLASLSTNRIFWNGDPAALNTWNTVVGNPPTYESTYREQGNTIVLISMNIAPAFQREGHASALINAAKELALELGGIDFVISGFRPLEYGNAKLAAAPNTVEFESYCELRREDGLLADRWLRTLERNGNVHLMAKRDSVVLRVTMEEFEEHKRNYRPERWVLIAGRWECGECGSWEADYDKGIATYRESNLYGRLFSRISDAAMPVAVGGLAPALRE